jgi:DHA2 family multidrug resistance protein
VAIYFCIQDKPKDREARRKIWAKGLDFDLVGFVLVATFLGALEVVLDKGQEDDWFGSSFIVTFTAISASALVLFIPWALLKSNPIIDIKMLASRQFGACFVVMLGVGAILIATTQMLPQMLQENYGYTATLSGLALSPGGIVTMVMMIVVGRLNFIQPKYLIAAGSAFVAYGMYYLTSLYGDTSFGFFAWSRMIVGVGLPLMFVPITTASYDGIPASKTDQASSLINLARNFGGSIGVSIAQTVLARREQFHQSRLAEQVGTWNPGYHQTLQNAQSYFAGQPSTGGSPSQTGIAWIGQAVEQQASFLSYIDVFVVLGVIAAFIIPLALTLRSVKAGKQQVAA